MFHREISKMSLNFDCFENYANKNFQVIFKYKDKKTIRVDLTLSQHSAWSKDPKTDVKLLAIAKVYSEFKISNARRDSMRNVENVRNTVGQQKPVTIDVPSQQEIKKRQSLNQKNSSKTFSYPLLSDNERLILQRVVTKCKLPDTYVHFDENIFCVTFLEKYKEDLEIQKTKFTEDLDTDMLRSVNEQLIKSE